MKFWPTTRTSW